MNYDKILGGSLDRFLYLSFNNLKPSDMKYLRKNRSEKNKLSLNKVKISAIKNPEKITGGCEGGWTIRKDKDKNIE